MNSKTPPDISSYDILLRKHQDNHVEIMSFSHHIGNRRFQIFLDIYQDSYNEALLKNDLEECERITGAIAHTICHSCIPRGRFLEQDNMTGWCDLGDGAITRERIRRGFLGLLSTLPIQIRPGSIGLPQKNGKEHIHVNLVEESVVLIENIPNIEPRNKGGEHDKIDDLDAYDGIVSNESNNDVLNVEITCDDEENDSSASGLETFDGFVSNGTTYEMHYVDTINKDEENDMSDSDSDTFDEIVSNEISYDIPLIHAPTMVSKSFIRNDDVLFFGENADVLFNFDHVGNNRLQHLLTQKSNTCYFDDQMDNTFMKYTLQLLQDFMQAYPNTRFLRQQNHTSIDMWIQMDVETAILKMSSSLFYASEFCSYFSPESDVEKPSNMNCNKRFKSESPQGSINSALSPFVIPPRCNMSRSKAA